MPLQVVGPPQGFSGLQGQGAGEGGSHQQRAGQSRTACEDDAVQVVHGSLRLGQRIPDDSRQKPQVFARGDLRDHSPELGVDLLRVQDVGEHGPVAQHGGGGLVAGSLDSKEEHREPRKKKPPGRNSRRANHTLRGVI